jgi:hypothetical protein
LGLLGLFWLLRFAVATFLALGHCHRPLFPEQNCSRPLEWRCHETSESRRRNGSSAPRLDCVFAIAKRKAERVRSIS